MTLSIRQRLTVTCALTFAVLFIIAGMAIVTIHSRLGMSRLDQEIGRLADTVASVLQNEIDEGLTPVAAAEDALDEVRAAGRGLVVLYEDGQMLAERWTRAQPTLPGDIRPVEALSTIDLPDGRWRMLSRSSTPAPAGYTVVALAPLDELEADRAIVLRALTIILPLALLLSAAAGWWVAGRALGPAALMAEQAHQITDRATSARLTVGRHDELGRLAVAFNALLDRLEHAIDARRHFLADASHELRTPVSVARTAADATLARTTRSEDEYRDALGIVSDQMKRLSRIIGDMLVLARSDTDRWPLHTTAFYAEELVGDCVRAIGLLAAQQQVGIELHARGDLQISGDEELLRQMVSNLLENAVGHTSSGETVRVDVSLEQLALLVSVRDRGPGIADADRDRIFERFVRTGSSGVDGTGLGLAIARRIAVAHGGDLQIVETGSTGTTFVASIPLR